MNGGETKKERLKENKKVRENFKNKDWECQRICLDRTDGEGYP